MISNSAPRRGQWADAPLVFVLAQARFLPSPMATPEGLLDAVRERVGSRFPTISQPTSLGIEINIDAEGIVQRTSQAPAYDLVNNDVDEMVRVQHGTLTYAVTSYVDSSNFREQWLNIARALEDVQVTTVSRLGLRYVDYLVPPQGRRPEDYVNAPWNLKEMPSLPGSAGGPDLHVSMVDVAYPIGRMRLQFMRGYGVPSLPMDLQGMLSPRQQAAFNQPGQCGVIDTDRWVDGEHTCDRATLNQLFTQMHTDVSKAFRAMITPLARSEWNPEEKAGSTS